MRPQPFTAISIVVVLVVAYFWIAATLGLPLGKLAVWLLAPTTWWGMTSFVLFWLGWIALTQLVYRERKRRRLLSSIVGTNWRMRTRTVRLGILALTAFSLYLGEANILASTGVANLPLSLVTTDVFRGFVIRDTLMVLTLVGVLAVGIVKKRERLEKTQS